MNEIPGDLRFLKSHEWARLEDDGTVTVGISDFAQGQLGDLVYVEVPAEGDSVEAGSACAVVESVKAASDVYAPIAGEVVAINESLKGKPESINADAFAAWMFRLKPVNAGDVGALLDAAGYEAAIAANK
ncbi:MAG: glycine cleavage system protein GcvH [Burkholderiaceae bacterium]|nr:glycine cleavage system protein GcvH [Burkholderiaceae bacterium]